METTDDNQEAMDQGDLEFLRELREIPEKITPPSDFHRRVMQTIDRREAIAPEFEQPSPREPPLRFSASETPLLKTRKQIDWGKVTRFFALAAAIVLVIPWALSDMQAPPPRQVFRIETGGGVPTAVMTPPQVAPLPPAPAGPPLPGRNCYIDYDNDSRYLVPFLEEQMREKNLTVIKKDDGNPSTLKVLLRSTATTETAFQTKMARISVNLSVQNSAGDELFHYTQAARGNSSTDYEQALKDASQIWASTIKQKGMIDRILHAQ